MTGLPPHPPPGPGPQTPVGAPARAVRKIVRKHLGDRTIEFVFAVATFLAPPRTYVTWELIEHTPLDCPCSPTGPDDVTRCVCGRVVCIRRHARTCSACGLVHCAPCLHPKRLHGAILCRACAFAMTATPLQRFCRALRVALRDVLRRRPR